MTLSCHLTSLLTFLIWIGVGVLLLAVVLHYVDKAMRH